MVKICSWNVNGIRAVHKKGFMDWLLRELPDILCLQETKAEPGQLEEDLIQIPGYESFWHWADKGGYSGVATYTRQAPINVTRHLGIDRFDREGRVLITEHQGFVLFNVYFPNGQMGDDRLKYKLDFYETLIDACNKRVQKGEKVIVCGDFNTAHREIDLKHPRANQERSGFLPVEREMLNRFLACGYVDVFRHLHPETIQYSWWSYRTRARSRNIGWRIDYFYISLNLLQEVVDCTILDDVQGSDHCPIGLLLRE